MNVQSGTNLITPRSFDNFFNPVGKIGLLLGEIAVGAGEPNGLKDPKHSSSSPAITGPPEVIVLP